MDDLDHVIGTVAAQHGILLDKNDPAAIIPTLVKLGIERGVRQVAEDDRARREELRALVQELRAESMKMVERQAAAIAEKVRQEVQLDLDRAGASAATLVANINHAHSRPVRVYWMTIGLIVATALLAVGAAVGKFVL